MPICMSEAAYTAESIAAQIKEPKDRLQAAVQPVIQAVRGKLLVGGYTPPSAAAIALAGASGGALKTAKTTKLLSGDEWVAARRKASSAGGVCRPAR